MRKHKLVFGPLAVGLCALSTDQALAQFDGFLKVDSIRGESRDSKHKDEIDILSFQHSISNFVSTATGSGHGAGKVTATFKFSMYQNLSSPSLYAACAQGEHLNRMVLTLRRPGKDELEYMKYTLSEVMVTGVQTVGTAGSSTQVLPIDEVTITFQKVEWSYVAQNPNGSAGGKVELSWDLKKNE